MSDFWINILNKHYINYNIILSENDDDLIIHKKKLYPLYKILNDECVQISFYILDNIIRIERISKCINSMISTTEFILDFVNFFRINLYHLISYIEIEIDSSYIDIYNVRIELYKLSLLTYGQTYYNRLGFGKQNEEWFNFVEQPFTFIIDKLGEKNIKKECITNFINYFLDNDDKIHSVFFKVKHYLQNKPKINVVIIIKEFIDLIFNPAFKIVPTISKNLKLYLK